MVLGYEFIALDEKQKHSRRVLLDWYPLVAQWSALLVLVAFQLSFLVSWLTKHGLEYERPRSPSFTKRLDGRWTWLRKSRHGWDKLVWWMKKDVLASWGTRAEWFIGGIWTVWLLSLCVIQTGNDYLHLTKRIGAIGASQLPLHYLLAMRSPYSPIQLLTRLSHEQLKSPHQVLGRIVTLLFVLHAAFYFNFFIQSNLLAKRIKDKDVIFGLVSIILFSVIGTTALSQLRRWNYRVFYISHVAIANILVIPLYLHVHHIRLYVWEVILVNALHLVLRFASQKIYMGTITLLPGTNLIQIRIPLTSLSSALSWQPGQHVYLSLPTGHSYSPSLTDQLTLRTKSNPFTVASLPVQDQHLLLIARTLNGHTRQMAAFARSLVKGDATGAAAEPEDTTPSIPLAIEGPYGASARLPDLAAYDSILLVAGGVGATFVLPIYRSVLAFYNVNHTVHPRVRFVWAVQRLADTQWAFPGKGEEVASGEEDEEEGEVMDTGRLATVSPPAIEVHVTRGAASTLPLGENGEEIELAEHEQLLSMEEEMKKPRKGMVLKTGRPKIAAIVDEVFGKGGRVAVISCGPKRLTSKLSDSVEQWVKQGIEVYWHEETFGW